MNRFVIEAPESMLEYAEQAARALQGTVFPTDKSPDYTELGVTLEEAPTPPQYPWSLRLRTTPNSGSVDIYYSVRSEKGQESRFPLGRVESIRGKHGVASLEVTRDSIAEVIIVHRDGTLVRDH